MVTKKTVTVHVGNIPQEVEEGSPTLETIQQLSVDCNLQNFTLMIDGKYIEEGDVIPDKITAELNGLIMLVPYDRAAV